MNWAAFPAPMGLLLLVLTSTASAVEVCYTEGGDATPLALVNNAVINNGELQVTADLNTQSGAIWFNEKVSTSGELHAYFEANITSQGAGADGVAFVMQNESASTIGASGGGIGYNGLARSIAIEFDTYTNSGDPDDNHIGLVTGGNATSHTATYTPAWTLENSRTHVWVDVVNGVIEVYAAQTNVKPASPVMTETVDVAGILGDDFWVGLTGSTGGSKSRHAFPTVTMADSAIGDDDGDSIPDVCEDGDDDGIPQGKEIRDQALYGDVDGDGIDAVDDDDSDGDGVSDADEGAGDADQNGIPDYFDPAYFPESGVNACADGLDSDGDGLVDYDDPDCTCDADLFANFEVTSLILNPSFQDQIDGNCPNSPSQITGYAEHWSQATGATSDYFACGFYYSGFGAIEGEFPAGDAWVGALSNGSYIEYIGNNTVEPLISGQEYTLEFWTAVPSATSYGGASAGDITVFGTTATSFPLNTSGDLETDANIPQDVLVRIPVDLQPSDGWVKVSTTFTPTSDYAGIIIGPGAAMTHPDSGYVHLMFDEININHTEAFSATMGVGGDAESGYALSAPQVEGVSYQWFLDGQAIDGATSSDYDIPQESLANGQYTVRIDDGNGCTFTEEDAPLIIEDAQGFDEDGDGIDDDNDACPAGESGWVSTPQTDFDGDGCQDASEDEDDDNDAVADVSDNCPTGLMGWVADNTSDHDADGCNDSDEDEDDDNDGISDGDDSCATGDIDWFSDNESDHDADGCQDSSEEDTDDDNDGISDAADICARGTTGWLSALDNDRDQDGCKDSDEDTDDDNDGVSDTDDACATGEMSWVAGPETDNDSDGCQDSSDEDTDDDNDGISDAEDDCARGDAMWASSPLTDYDADGCRDDSEEDADDDNDGVSDTEDACALGDGGEDQDGDGCSDDEDDDDDNDGILDAADSCPNGQSDWTSAEETDLDADGCSDAEDDDVDGDGLSNDDEGAGDPDEDGLPNFRDTDSDDDGMTDDEEVDPLVGTDPYSWDTDNDSLSDREELFVTGTDPLNSDTDDDGSEDSTELLVGTDPLNPDSDNDGISDGDEIDEGTNPNRSDSDNDGISDADERLEGTNPLDGDSDDDGVRDGDELDDGTDPLAADSDNDGMTDGDERDNGTDPMDDDSDDDGLNDGDEAYAQTNPMDDDSDGDGRKDGDEVNSLTDPNSDDTDADGMTDGEEYVNGTDALLADTDGDGLDDGEEDALETDPRVVDTDGDGMNDGDEVDYGSDPLTPGLNGTLAGGSCSVTGGSAMGSLWIVLAAGLIRRRRSTQR